MDIRPLTDNFAVSPQITPDDVSVIREAGFATVICNRPDDEVPAQLQADALRAAVEGAGLRFVLNPLAHGSITEDHIAAQGRALAESAGPVLAYCASGNRSSVAWALAHAGMRPTDELIGLPARYGYALESLRPMIDALAARKA